MGNECDKAVNWKKKMKRLKTMILLNIAQRIYYFSLNLTIAFF